MENASEKESDPGAAFLAGNLLIAMPGLGDPRFHRAVVFVCAHDPNGAMGLVLNRPLKDLLFAKVLHDLDIPMSPSVSQKLAQLPVMGGGPVEPGRGFLLHSGDFFQKDTIRLNDSFHVSGTIDALKDVATGCGPKDLLLALGYAGWHAGQLEEEMRQNAWLAAPADPHLVFGVPPAQKWETALKTLRIDPAMLAVTGGQA